MAQSKYYAEDYPIIVSRFREYLRFTNYDFGIEIFEKCFLPTEEEKRIQIAVGIRKMHEKIADHMKAKLHRGLPCPVPTAPSKVIPSQSEDLISLAQACQLLGELPHNVRRMADRGELKISRTKRGHRRFFRSDVERVLLQRSNPDANLSE